MDTDDRLFKEKSISATHISGRNYAIFRVGDKKLKSLNDVKKYEYHMERKQETPNANPWKDNIRLIGSDHVYADVKEYTKDCKLRSNNVIARDLLLTASPQFFHLPQEQLQRWIDLNVKFLKDNFGDNCVYATLHRDETTWHISALIVPKFYNERIKANILSSKRYFGSKQLLSEWQDKYSLAMQSEFKSLNRGIKWSKAKHIEIRHFYSLVNSKLNDRDIQSVLAQASNAELLEKKIKSLEGTLNAYKGYSKKTDEEKQLMQEQNKNLVKQVQELKKDKEVFKETIKALSVLHNIPQNAIYQTIKYIENDLGREK